MFPDVCCYKLKPSISLLQKKLTEYEEMAAMTSYLFFLPK